MCGIAGFVDLVAGTGGDELAAVANRMADSLRHRGPDSGGVWTDPAAGVALSHRRLAVLDLSAHGHQPMVSACGRYVTAYNGEIYNFRSLRKELERRNHRFQGSSDTEVLLAAVSEWGPGEALTRLNGMFAFALWDRRDRVLHLVRDRLGEKPLYYGAMGSAVLFASELKALRAHPRFEADVDRDALAAYLRHNYVPSPHSIYRGVKKLEPGTVVSHAMGRPTTAPLQWRYWSAGEAAERGVAEPFEGTAADAEEELDGLLRDAVRLRMEADVPLGAFLSGGIDSSTVVALMQAQAKQPVRTFTIGFDDDSYDEAVHARGVAAHLGTDHTELYVAPGQALQVIPRLPSIYDEPFADSSQIPTFLVCEMARRHVTVSLSGDGGDEVFAGYDRYAWGRALWRSLGWLPSRQRAAAGRLLTRRSAESWERVLGGLGRVVPGRMLPSRPGDKVHRLGALLQAQRGEDVYLQLLSHWPEPAAVVLGAKEAPTALREVWATGAVHDFTGRMMLVDTVGYLPDDILTKVDRASMAVGLEARVPLLDHRVVEWAWRLPLAMKAGVQAKWLLRQVLHRYVPEHLVERPKMGFGVPVGQWLRGPLRDWAEGLLGERRLRDEGFFDPAPIREKWAEHLSGARDWRYDLWDVLVFQAWLEDQKGGGGQRVGSLAGQAVR